MYFYMILIPFYLCRMGYRYLNRTKKNISFYKNLNKNFVNS